MGWDDLAALAAAGVTIGSHGMSHADLRRLSPEDLWRETTESRGLLEERLGVPVEGFAYPYGLFDRRVVDAVRSAGYRWAVTTSPSPWRGRGNPFRIRRVTLHGSDSPLRARLKTSFLHDLAYLPEIPLLVAQKAVAAVGKR